ncbi:MAG: hypothetical protein MRY83_23495 [Flavobacteriales bacterium]|nr:hypothetical protein [Flavobacteriales bacterium]
MLDHKKYDRGMLLMADKSRCLRRSEIHEIATTDETNIHTNACIDRIGFLGFVEIETPYVVEVNDLVFVDSKYLGRVAGFNSCHFPNHYNIIIKTEELLTSDDLKINIDSCIQFFPKIDEQEKKSNGVMFSAIIMGFGHSGRDLHANCLKNLGKKKKYQNLSIFAVDPIYQKRLDGIGYASGIEKLKIEDKSNAVVHICTPPNLRESIIEKAVDIGYQKFLIEKPLCSVDSSISDLKKIISNSSLDILVVSNWSCSRLFFYLKERLSQLVNMNHEIYSIKIIQNKSRVSVSLNTDSHSSALDVEFPHMLVLLCLLVNSEMNYKSGKIWDMHYSRNIVENMGGAYVDLESKDGIKIYLESNLMSPIKQRSVELKFTNGYKIQGFFPVDSSDFYSYLYEFDNKNNLKDEKVFYDNTLESFFKRAYDYFFSNGKKPLSDISFHYKVCEMLAKIKHNLMEDN